jgi:hypothetical protein
MVDSDGPATSLNKFGWLASETQKMRVTQAFQAHAVRGRCRMKRARGGEPTTEPYL